MIQKKEYIYQEEQQIIKDAASFILSCVNTAETKKEEERLENERLEKIYESLSGQDFSKAVKGKNSKIDTDEKTLSKFNAILTNGGKNPSKKIGKEDLRRISLLAEHPDRTSKIIRDEKRSK